MPHVLTTISFFYLLISFKYLEGGMSGGNTNERAAAMINCEATNKKEKEKKKFLLIIYL